MPASSGGSSTFPTPDEMVVLSQSSESTSGGTCDDLSSSGYQIHDCSLGSSCRPIRYFNGGMVLSETDISSSGVGMPWSHRRSFMNQMDQNGCLNNGNNWLPAPAVMYLKDVNGDGSVVAAVMSPQDAFWFDDEGSLGYVGRHGIKEELVVGTNELILCRPDGSVYTFYDFSQTNEGLLKSITSRGGATVSFTYNTDGKIEEVTRTSGSTTESFLYTYLGSTDDNEGELEEVLCRRKEGAGSCENVAR